MVPIFGIAGQAGSGKGALATYLAGRYNGVSVAQADPMKRIVSKIFPFTEEQLWGPSEKRNEMVNDVVIGACRQRAYQVKADFLKVFKSHTDNVTNALFDHFFPACQDFIDQKEGISPRMVLQTIGTEIGRRVNSNAWNQHCIETLKELLCGGHLYDKTQGLLESPSFKGYSVAVCDDVRFRNEVLGFRSTGGIVIKIVRSDPSAAAKTAAAGVSGHQSEAELGGIPDHFYDHILHNDGTLEDLYEKGDLLMSVCYGIKPVDNS